MKLSLCIPTYNRSIYLRDLLDSIVAQLYEKNKDLVEICISDNASTDDTKEKIKDYMDSHEGIRIHFHQNSENLGPDRNYIESVRMAHGEYAWIIGSDDKLRDGAIERILSEIIEEHDVYIMSRTCYSVDFSKKMNTQCFFKEELGESFIFHLDDVNGWDQYLNSANNLGAVFSFLSSIVFKKQDWDNITDYDSYIGTAYVHVYILLKMLLRKKSRLKMISDSYIMNRQGNDSFFVNPCQRVMLDYDGYLRLSNLFEHPLLRKDFKEILIKEWPYPSYQIPIRTNDKDFNSFIDRMKKIGYDDQLIESLQRLHKHKILASMMNVDHVYNFLKRMIKHE